MPSSPRLVTPLLSLLASAGVALAGQNSSELVTFSQGAEGWSINGLTAVTQTGGNPAARLHWNDPIDTFGIEARTDSNVAFIGDYSAKGDVRLSMDFQVDYINFFGTPASRELVVILFDDDSYNGAPPASVWTSVGVLPGSGMPWTTFSADVTDVLSDELPAGWQGAGDEDPNTFEPILPAGRTWANVLQGVDRVQFTTYVPGYFFGFTNFKLSIDNVAIEPLNPTVVGDVNADGLVDGADLAVLLGSWGRCAECPADLDGSGAVDGADLALMLGNWSR